MLLITYSKVNTHLIFLMNHSLINEIFIHYGNDIFLPELIKFKRYLFNKPTGYLWASRLNADKKMPDIFRDERFDKYFKFTLNNNSNILIIDNNETYQMFIDTYCKEYNNYFHIFFGEPIDYLSIAKDYDGMFISNKFISKDIFQGYDIESLIIFNPKIVNTI